MLHYSNASNIEENRRYLVIKGGGACLVAQTRRRVVVDVVDHRGISGSLGVYRKSNGGGT